MSALRSELYIVSIFTLLELLAIPTYGWNFPKYYISFIPFMALAMLPVLNKIKLEKKEIMLGGLLFLVFLSYFLLIPDPYMPEVSEAFTQKNYSQIIFKTLFNLDLLLIPIVIIFLVIGGYKNKEQMIKALLITSIILFLCINIMQITKPYSTNNLYRDSISNLEQTLSYLENNTNQNDAVFVFNHVGYYFGNENNSNWYNSALCHNSEKCMENITANKQVKFMQFYDKDLLRLDGELKNIIEEEFKYDRNFGEYILYKRK